MLFCFEAIVMSSFEIPRFPVISDEFSIILDRYDEGPSDVHAPGGICDSGTRPGGIIKGGFDINNGRGCVGIGVNVGKEPDPERDAEE